MSDKSEPQPKRLMDFDTFFWLLEDRYGLEAIAKVSTEIGLVNTRAREVVDLRPLPNGRHALYFNIDIGVPVVVILDFNRKSRKYFGAEGGFLKV